MPIFRSKNELIYFSHIPKCGGTSVENFVNLVPDITLSFLDRNFYKDKSLRWSISSPQHITGKQVEKLFPISFFDVFFTITRNPFDRFCSAFSFQKNIAKKIPMQIDINQFINNLDKYRALLPGHFDNHFLPQVEFLYPGAYYKVFKFENGLDNVKKFIGSFSETDLSNISMPHTLKTPAEMKTSVDSLNNNSRKIIMDAYKLDFDQLVY